MSEKPRLIIVETGVANLASVRALAERLGMEPVVSANPEHVARAQAVILPGVGAFGPPMHTLKEKGRAPALKRRVSEGFPTAGICLGMQLFFEASEESEGVEGLGIFKGTVRRLEAGLALPQLGWNRLEPEPEARLLRPGWVYFANSYGLGATAPDARPELSVNKGSGAWSFDSIAAATTTYGSPFVSAVEAWRNGRPSLLLCQFHPELSGTFGMQLFARWLDLNGARRSV
jgi:glutamine amidotransferase